MAIYYSLDEYTPDKNGSCVALGFFDGVHLGHRAVLEVCSASELRCVAMTFAESPGKALNGSCPPLLTDNRRKAELLSDMGADDVIFADFSALKDKTAGSFVTDILRDRLNAKQICCGFNYRFGKGGAGDTRELIKLCSNEDITVRVSDPVSIDGEHVSSTKIRELISAGELRRANVMLGYRYSICGDIGSGNRIGSSLGYPTVNIPIADGLAVPRYGVYASKVCIDGKSYIAATNIGVHPTAGESPKPLCESYLLDFSGEDLYGKSAVCELIGFIRDERKFDSLESLQKQISDDCIRIKNIAGDVD